MVETFVRLGSRPSRDRLVSHVPTDARESKVVGTVTATGWGPVAV